MSTKRVKKKVISNVTLEQAQQASELFAQKSTSLSKLEAKMNEEINAIKSKYQEEITDLKEQMEEPVEVLEVFAEEQKTSWGKKKSFELLHCVIGYRTGMPKVIKDKKFTWDAITTLVQKAFPKLIRTEALLDKEGIIAMSKEKEFNKVKEQCYIDVVQEETFFVTAKSEELVS